MARQGVRSGDSAGAILAVCWEYRARIAALACGVRRDPVALRFVVGLGLAFCRPQ